ncbi:DMT family transporter [Arsenicitalea aurantiaca]|uniref:DMT family transporter n=1 Tax=Arsenicitalea aurantiaca TaxID=1783274 RepID=A0A433XM47_9HYPH|nr:DMT family transporter [Arsenicitalea aurantiaca]RUT35157.1 DMT family transporter [Arsenicitalea aurantiaca]
MTPPASNLRGIALMVLATGVFVINDTLLKLATDGLPPMQVLFLRGLAATFWGVPLILFTGNLRNLKGAFDRIVLFRNVTELFAVLCFIVALANMPIADITAIGQIAPMVLLLGVSLIYGEKIGLLRMGLIALGFVGAILVAQPSGEGFSIYAILAFFAALLTAARDIIGRKVPAYVPGPVVAFGTILVVMAGAGIATFFFEPWVAPAPHHLMFVAGSGFFLTIGHVAIFLAYRQGSTASVAPFYYTFTVWAVISGVVVFSEWPNLIASIGIVLVVGSGLAVVLLDERRRRLLITA